MKLGIKGNAFVVFACAALAFIGTARAQTTNYFADLRAEIAARVDDTNTTRQEKATLKAADNSLKKPGKTFSAQLGQLATAATILDKRFTNDTELAASQEATLEAYFDEAEAQFEDVEARLGTNSVSRGISNQLTKAWVAVTNAAANTNGVAERARLLAKAFNKMRIPITHIQKKYEHPGNGGGGGGGNFEAPAELAFGQSFRLEQQNADHMPMLMDLWTFAGGDNGMAFYPYKHYHISNLPPDGEIGTWTYVKTGPKNGVITMLADYPASAQDRTVDVTFTSATTGTFSTTVISGNFSGPVTGRMSINTNFTPTP
jgi:hypothetical protein